MMCDRRCVNLPGDPILFPNVRTRPPWGQRKEFRNQTRRAGVESAAFLDWFLRRCVMRSRAIVLAAFALVGVTSLVSAQIVVPENALHRRPGRPPVVPIYPIPRPVPSSYSIRTVDVAA